MKLEGLKRFLDLLTRTILLMTGIKVLSKLPHSKEFSLRFFSFLQKETFNQKLLLFLGIFLLSYGIFLIRKRISQKSYVFLSLVFFVPVAIFLPVTIEIKIILGFSLFSWLFPPKNKWTGWSYLFISAFYLSGFFTNFHIIQQMAVILLWLNFLFQLITSYQSEYTEVFRYASKTSQFAEENYQKVSQTYFLKRFFWPFIIGVLFLPLLFLIPPTSHFSGFKTVERKEAAPLILENTPLQMKEEKTTASDLYEQIGGKENVQLKKFWENLTKVVMVVMILGGSFGLFYFLNKNGRQALKELFTSHKKMIPKKEVLSKDETKRVWSFEGKKQEKKSFFDNSWHFKIRRVYQKKLQKLSSPSLTSTPQEQVAPLNFHMEDKKEILNLYEKIRYDNSKESTKEEYIQMKKLLNKK